MKKYTALFAALTLVLALAGCGAETQTPMPGQSEQEEFTQNSTENVNETDGMTLLDSVFDTLSEGTDVTIIATGLPVSESLAAAEKLAQEAGHILGHADAHKREF